MPCPHCQRTDYRYSHRRAWERLISKLLPWRPFRCRGCRKRFWGSTRAETTSGFRIGRHLGWLAPLALVFAVAAVYMNTLPYDQGTARRPGERPPPGQSAADGGLENQPSGRRLRGLELTAVEGGLRLKISGAGPLEPSALRHFKVPERLVLDLPGPWTRPAPSTQGLVHPLLDRVRLIEQGRDLRLELLLRETAVGATLEETEDGLVITVKAQ